MSASSWGGPSCRCRGCRYNVQDYYRDDGCAQRVAKSPLFDNLTSLLCATSIEITTMLQCELLAGNSCLAVAFTSTSKDFHCFTELHLAGSRSLDFLLDRRFLCNRRTDAKLAAQLRTPI